MRFRQGLAILAIGIAIGIAVEKLWTAQVAGSAIADTFQRIIRQTTE